MLHGPVEEMAVVADNYQAAAVAGEILFEYVQGHDVEVVGRLVENQQIRIPHQYGEQVEPAPFATGEP